MKTSANLDAERAVLSALVQDVDPVPAFAQLTPKDFFDTFHQRLFAHFKSTIEHGHPLNHTDIVDEMKLQGMEVARLAEMSNPLMVVRKPGELARLVRIVKRDSVGRDLKKTCGEMVEANGDATGLIANLQAKVQNYIESLRETIEPPGILASTVVPKKVKWLWRGRIPLGKITMFDGDPDNGKSAISVDLVARITSGKPMPDDSPCPEGGAVIISNEDDDEDTIVPRLLRAGANMKRVRLLRDIESPEGKRQLEIPLDIPAIRQAALSVNAKIIVFDP
ncbi:MAG: AAA family ATPase, partial [Candidatus Acidiferrales bacterium]